MVGFLAVTFYAAMVTAGYLVEIIFGVAGLVPSGRHAKVEMAQVSWNYTTFLNIAFLAVAAVLVVRFVRTGGTEMLTRMGGGPDDMAGHTHGRHGGHGQGATTVCHCPPLTDLAAPEAIEPPGHQRPGL